MFNNPGNIIKESVKSLCVILLILVVIIGLLAITQRNFILGIFIILGGGLSVYLSCLLLYAFGEIVENINTIKNNTEKVLNMLDDTNESGEA